MNFQSQITDLVAPCGLHCEKCLAFQGGEIHELSSRLAELLGSNFKTYAKRFQGMNPVFDGYEEFRDLLEFMGQGTCRGCRSGGSLFHQCPIQMCVMERGIDFCYQCEDFPCELDGVPGMLKKRWEANNTKLQSMGPEKYLEMLRGKHRYP
jgi:hypothetical protein